MSSTNVANAERLGGGDYVYELVDDWAKLPEGWAFRDASGIAVDVNDNVYVFSRAAHPIIVFDRDGNYLTSWGDGVFKRPHGAFMGPDDSLWLTDEHDHTVRKCTLDGKILLELGTPGKSEPFMSGRPFNRPTHTALSPGGDLYVSDGYGNSTVHKFAPDGRYLKSWGEPGADPGEFNVVHNITCDDQGWVYVADRENFRIQVFDGEGRFETQWHNFYRPAALFTTRGTSPVTFVGEGGPQTPVGKSVPNLGARVTIMDRHGKRLATIGDRLPGPGRTQFMAPHSITMDSRGDLYVSEVSWGNWPKKFPDEERPAGLRSLRKLRKVHSAA